MKYPFLVVVETDNFAQANQVMAERIGHDEDYGFEYQIDWGHEYEFDNENQIVLYTGIYHEED